MSVGKVTGAQLAEYQKAAIKYRKEFLAMIVIGIDEILPYVTVRSNIRGKERVGTTNVDAQFAPYKRDMKSGKDIEIAFRELETFMGAVDHEFEPNTAVLLPIGQNADTKGEGQKNADIVKQMLIDICKSLAEKLNLALWSAVRNPNGTTTNDLFNGWDTITTNEITAGNIAASKGNYVKLDTEISSLNAVDVLKNAYRKASDVLKGQKTIMYVPRSVLEAYEDAYSLIHNATPWVKGFEQKVLEGSDGLCQIVPLTSKAGSKYIHVSTKQNMLIGVDQMSNLEDIEVARFSAFTLEFIATMFFGVEFESIDKRRLLVIEMAGEEGSGSGSGN